MFQIAERFLEILDIISKISFYLIDYVLICLYYFFNLRISETVVIRLFDGNEGGFFCYLF